MGYRRALQPTVSAKCEIPTKIYTTIGSGSIHLDVSVFRFRYQSRRPDECFYSP